MDNGHEHEFGGSGARFRRLRRRRGVPGDALVWMTIKTGDFIIIYNNNMFIFQVIRHIKM